MTVSDRAATLAARKSYVPVPVDIFTPGHGLDFSLYGRSKDGAIAVVCPAGGELTTATLRPWHDLGARVFYVDTGEHRLYQKFAEAAFHEILGRNDLTVQKKFDLTYKTTLELVREAVSTSSLDEVVGERREKWADNLVTLICGDPSAVEGLVSMLSHDYYTYTHMVNVSTLATLLAHRLGERDPERLKVIAGGGLLHDMGKLRINPDTLNKVGPLTPDEWAELKTHPSLGLDLLHGRPDIREAELLIVHEHHEKLDGSGYPLGLRGSEISREAQITTVVDIYDALTCKRPYRPALSHEKASAILAQEAVGKLNAEMVCLWQEIMNRVVAQEA